MCSISYKLSIVQCCDFQLLDCTIDFLAGILLTDKGPLLQKSVRNCFIRGSVVRYLQLPANSVDVELLHDATRREARGT